MIEHSSFLYESILEVAELKTKDFSLIFVYYKKKSRQANELEDINSLAQSLSSKIKFKFSVIFSINTKRENLDYLLRIKIDYDLNKISATII